MSTLDASEQHQDSLLERLKPWPTTRLRELFVVIAFSLPFLAVTFITAASGGFSALGPNSNSSVLVLVQTYMDKGIDPWAMFTFYPSLTNGIGALASLTGGSALFLLALFGSFVAAGLLTGIAELLRQKKVPFTLRAALISIFLLNPIIYYNAMFNLEALAMIAFFGLGLAHMIRFVQWGSTYSGFIAGLLFSGAIATSQQAILLVAIALLSLLGFRLLYQGHRGSVTGIITVLLYPSALFIIALTVISFALYGSFTHFMMIATDGADYSALALEEHGAAWINIPQLNGISIVGLQGLSVFTLFLPLVLLFVINPSLKSKIWATLTGFLFISVQILTNVNNPTPFPSGATFLMITILGIVMLAENRGRALELVVLVAAGFQLLVGWITAASRPETIIPWMSDIGIWVSGLF